MERPRVIVIGTAGALLVPTIRALAQEADLIVVESDAPVKTDLPDPPSLERVIELAMIETLKDIDGIRLDLLDQDKPEDRMNPARPIGRIVDNAEATGANGHAARAVYYSQPKLLAETAP